jgi:hypothetical protein
VGSFQLFALASLESLSSLSLSRYDYRATAPCLILFLTSSPQGHLTLEKSNKGNTINILLLADISKPELYSFLDEQLFDDCLFIKALRLSSLSLCSQSKSKLWHLRTSMYFCFIYFN